MNPALQCRCIEWSPELGCCLKRKVVDIPHKRVQSSNIYSVGYDAALLILEVTFIRDGKAGDTYRYFGVSPEHHAALMEAESIGKHFAAHIKGKYETKKMEESKPDGN